MEAGLYFPVYRRCFRGGNSMFSLWPLSRFVTKLFIYKVTLKKRGFVIAFLFEIFVRFLCFVFVTKLRYYAQKLFDYVMRINALSIILKVYIERNHLQQLELIRRIQCNIAHQTHIYQEVSNTNHFGRCHF